MSSGYFISHNGVNHGPHSVSEIEAKFHAGELNQSDQVYLSERSEWIPILTFMMTARQAPHLPPQVPSKPPPGVFQKVDATAVLEIKVLPPKQTKLHLQVSGDPRVGENIEILVSAMTESGAIDGEFSQKVALICDRPIKGLEPLKFHQGQARLTLRCQHQGNHRFSLKILDGFAERSTASH